MPNELTKEERYNLYKVLSFFIIFEFGSILLSIGIYKQFNDLGFVLIWFSTLTPIIVWSSLSYLLFKYRIFVRFYLQFFFLTFFTPLTIGSLLLEFLRHIPSLSVYYILILTILLLDAGFLWITDKIVLFLANRYINISLPSSEMLEKNTLIYRIDEKNKNSKINSLLILLEELFNFYRVRDVDNKTADHWLLKSKNNTSNFILIYTYKNTLLITPFKNSIYKYEFDNPDTFESINDLVISLFNFEKINIDTDEESKFAFSDYFKMFQNYSGKKSEIRELIPFIKLIIGVAIIIIAIILLFLFYSKIPEFFQYLQNVGAMQYIVLPITVAIILWVGNYLQKILQKKIFKK